DEHVLKSEKRCVVVGDNGQVVGILTPHEVKDVDREKWPQLTVAEVMLPLEKLHAVKPATSLTEALETMGREDINRLPVMSDGHLDGIISRSHILRLLQTRAELQV